MVANNNKSFSTASKHNTTATTAAATFIPLMAQSGLEEETAESILDLHCSRIWSSSHQTPSRSPSRQSPPRTAKSPERLGGLGLGPSRSALKAKQASALPLPPQQSSSSEAAAASASSAMLGNVSFPRAHHRSKKEPSLSKSFDSGMGSEEKGLLMRGETHRHIHHHHHHHHSRDVSSKQRLELEAQQQGGVYWREPSGFVAQEQHGRGRTSAKKGVVRKSSDASSNIDSGISMVYETDSTRVVPNWSNPSSEKYVRCARCCG